MDDVTISINNVPTALSTYIRKYVEFAGQALHDKAYLDCAKRLLPFDGMAHAFMYVFPNDSEVRKMGVIVMRMNIEPPLYSLGVTTMILQKHNSPIEKVKFLKAWKFIEELQEYVKEDGFRDQVISLCNIKTKE